MLLVDRDPCPTHLRGQMGVEEDVRDLAGEADALAICPGNNGLPVGVGRIAPWDR